MKTAHEICTVVTALWLSSSVGASLQSGAEKIAHDFPLPSDSVGLDQENCNDAKPGQTCLLYCHYNSTGHVRWLGQSINMNPFFIPQQDPDNACKYGKEIDAFIKLGHLRFQVYPYSETDSICILAVLNPRRNVTYECRNAEITEIKYKITKPLHDTNGIKPVSSTVGLTQNSVSQSYIHIYTTTAPSRLGTTQIIIIFLIVVGSIIVLSVLIKACYLYLRKWVKCKIFSFKSQSNLSPEQIQLINELLKTRRRVDPIQNELRPTCLSATSENANLAISESTMDPGVDMKCSSVIQKTGITEGITDRDKRETSLDAEGASKCPETSTNKGTTDGVDGHKDKSNQNSESQGADIEMLPDLKISYELNGEFSQDRTMKLLIRILDDILVVNDFCLTKELKQCKNNLLDIVKNMIWTSVVSMSQQTLEIQEFSFYDKFLEQLKRNQTPDEEGHDTKDTAGSPLGLGGVATNSGSAKIGSNCVTFPASAPQRLIYPVTAHPLELQSSAGGGSYGTDEVVTYRDAGKMKGSGNTAGLLGGNNNNDATEPLFEETDSDSKKMINHWRKQRDIRERQYDSVLHDIGQIPLKESLWKYGQGGDSTQSEIKKHLLKLRVIVKGASLCHLGFLDIIQITEKENQACRNNVSEMIDFFKVSMLSWYYYWIDVIYEFLTNDEIDESMFNLVDATELKINSKYQDLQMKLDEFRSKEEQDKPIQNAIDSRYNFNGADTINKYELQRTFGLNSISRGKSQIVASDKKQGCEQADNFKTASKEVNYSHVNEQNKSTVDKTEVSPLCSDSVSSCRMTANIQYENANNNNKNQNITPDSSLVQSTKKEIDAIGELATSETSQSDVQHGQEVNDGSGFDRDPSIT